MSDRRAYNRNYCKARYYLHRSRVDKLKDNPCMDCGRREPPYNMHWDHRPGEIKIARVSQMMNRPWEIILAEIAKCDLVCSLCHGYRTHIQRDHRGSVIAGMKAKEDKQHEANATRHRAQPSTSEWARQFP